MRERTNERKMNLVKINSRDAANDDVTDFALPQFGKAEVQAEAQHFWKISNTLKH